MCIEEIIKDDCRIMCNDCSIREGTIIYGNALYCSQECINKHKEVYFNYPLL